MARANGEGTIYETIQKIKRKFDNTKMCKISLKTYARVSSKDFPNGRVKDRIFSLILFKKSVTVISVLSKAI